MGVTFFVRETENYINDVSVDFGQTVLLDGPKEGQKLIVWDFKKYYEWPRRIGFYIETRKVDEGFLNIQLTLESRLLRLTFPSQDNFFDQLFIGDMKVKLKGKDIERELIFPRVLGDPTIPIDELRLKYESSLYLGNLNRVGELPIDSTPIARSVIWPCGEELLEVEITIGDLLIMRNRSNEVEEYWKGTKRTVSLPSGLSAAKCSN